MTASNKYRRLTFVEALLVTIHKPTLCSQMTRRSCVCLGLLQRGNDISHQLRDYNSDVLTHWTIPNVLLNVENGADKSVDFYSGDWLQLASRWESEQHDKYDIILSAETIYRADLYDRFLRIIEVSLAPKGTAYLLFKSSYGPGGTLFDFLDVLTSKSKLRPELKEVTRKGIVKFVVLVKWE